jgi:hypothetical protein
VRLIAQGCSLTSGMGLEHPRTQSWPVLLAELLDCELINLGEPANDPKRVAHLVQHTQFASTDIQVILWPSTDRLWIYPHTRIGPWTKTKAARAYYRWLYNSQDSNQQLAQRAHYAGLVHPRTLHTLQYPSQARTFDQYRIPYYSTLYSSFRMQYPSAPDGVHPDSTCNRDWAIKLAEHVKKNF